MLGFPGGLAVKNLPTVQELQETQVQSLGQKDPLEEGMATHSCLENPMDRGAWQATIHGVSESRTQLKQLSMHASCKEIRTVSAGRERA